VNSENHIIKDRYEEPVSYEALRTSLLQQFLHGVGASTIWVWEDANYAMTLKKHDFAGSIYRRPACVLAASDASVEANRAAPQIVGLFNAKPETAMVYSAASNLFDPLYSKNAKELFTALSFNGRKIGFLSEAQLRKGEASKYKAVFAASASVLEPESFKALASYAAAGGKIYSYGDCFVKDVYGAKPGTPVKANALDASSQGLPLFKAVAKILDENLSPLPAKLVSTRPEGLYGVEWRVVSTPADGLLLNACNYNAETVPVKLEGLPAGAKVEEVLSGAEIKGEALELKPLSPVLLKIR
jgi:hypothetical protein